LFAVSSYGFVRLVIVSVLLWSSAWCRVVRLIDEWLHRCRYQFGRCSTRSTSDSSSLPIHITQEPFQWCLELLSLVLCSYIFERILRTKWS